MPKNAQKTKINGKNTGDIAGGNINKGNKTSFHFNLSVLIPLSLFVASGTVVVKMGWANTIIQNIQNINLPPTYPVPTPYTSSPSKRPSEKSMPSQQNSGDIAPSKPSVPSKASSTIKGSMNLIEGQRVVRTENVVGTINGFLPSDKQLYIYVKASSLREFQFYYFPVTLREQNWFAQVYFGAVETTDQGLSFETGLVLANPKDQRWNDRNSDNGISTLIGELVTDSVTVQRK